jgi:nicotinamide-nucleotide amidase
MTQAIQQLVAELGKKLEQKNWSLATAESCTGGGVAYFITNSPGTSTWFERGFVTYSNESKQEMLGVKEQTLGTKGAVSSETAKEMAEGALHHSRAQVSLAITGIAGPTGGSKDKPIGTVWFGWAGTTFKTVAYCEQISGDRAAVREKSIAIALQKLCALIDLCQTTNSR